MAGGILAALFRSIKLALLLGFLLWLVPFVISLILGTVRSSDRIFFETLMPIVITLIVVSFAYIYFTKVSSRYLREGLAIGILWLIISIAFDLPMFSWGPMAMSLTDYMKDIGLTYLIFPIITVGIGYILENKTKA